MKRFVLSILFLLLLASCTTKPTQTAGGTSSETVFGKIVKADGSAAPNTHVQLLPTDYDPVAGLLSEDTLPKPDTTNDSGEYVIAVGDTGVFNLEAVHLEDRTRLLIQGIEVRDQGSEVSDEMSGDSLRVATDTLRAPWSVVVTLADTAQSTGAYVYVPGTTINRSPVTGHRLVVLDSVPQGLVPEVYYRSSLSDSALKVDTVTIVDFDSGLVAYWDFEQDVSNGLSDVTNNGYDGTIHSEPTKVTGMVGSAWNFDGIDDYVEIGKTFVPPLQGTVTFWMKPIIQCGQKHRMISGNDSFEVIIRLEELGNHLFACSTTMLKVQPKLQSDTWYHVACTYDYGTKRLEVYVNGELAAADDTLADDRVLQCNLSIGTGLWAPRFYEGLLDEMRIYDRVLRAVEVTMLYQKRE